jgi:hypothetical protein
MKSLAKTLVGLALVLSWWTLRGGGDSNTETTSKIPTVVWDGGAGQMTIHAETSCAAQMRVGFSDHREGVKDPRDLNAWEDIPAGSHSWTIDVPADVGGYVELSAAEPKPGDHLRWSIEVGGATVDEQSDTLEKALEPGWGFALQSYFDDYATGTLGEG